MREILTVQPFGVVFCGPFRLMNLLAGGPIVEFCSEDERISSLRVAGCARVEGRRLRGISSFHKNGRRIVLRIEGALGLGIRANGVNVVARNGEI